MQAAIDAVNPHLPEYARVSAWVRAEAPLSPANGMLTATGRPRRAQVWAVYGARIERLYVSEPTGCLLNTP